MVLTCMEEAKRLVDTAYKEQRERWVTGHFPALGKAAPGLLEKELDAGTSWVRMGTLCLPVSLCVFGFENITPHGLASVWIPRSVVRL